MIKKIRENKGITGVDATIGVVILIIFVPLVASLFSNIVNVNLKNKRKATALNIAIQIIEGIKLMDYDSIVSGITAEDALGESGDLNEYILPKGFTVDTIAVVEQDGYKEVTVSIGYIQNNQKENVELKTIITQKVENQEKIEILGEITNPKATYEENDNIDYEITVSNISDTTLYNVHVVLENLENQYGETYANQEWDISEPFTAGATEKFTTKFIARNGIWNANIKVTATTQLDGGDTIEYTKKLFVYRLTLKEKMIAQIETINDSQNDTGYDLEETVNFKVIITNTGTSTIKGVSIDSAKGFEENIIERIEPGETKEVTGYSYTIKEEDIGKGTLTYPVKVTTTEPSLEQTIEATFKVADTIAVISAEFEETSKPTQGGTYNYYKDTSINFSISISNIGNSRLKNVSIKLYIGNDQDGPYDYIYSWTEDIGINSMKTIRKSVLPTDIRLENFSGSKVAFVEIIDENGNKIKSKNIILNLSNTEE